MARCVQPYTEAAAKAKADYDAKYKVVQDKKPKRPLSAYMLFSNSARPKVKAAEALYELDRLAREAKRKKWDLQKLIVQAWAERPAAS